MNKLVIDGAGKGLDVGSFDNGDGYGSLYSSLRVTTDSGDGFGSESCELDGDGKGTPDEWNVWGLLHSWGQPSAR